MKKIAFVTGADGFIGSHLVEYLLEKNFKVHALSVYNSFGTTGWLDFIKKEKNLNIINGDIRDNQTYKSELLNSHYVFHLSALISIPYSYLAYRSFVDVNINGLISLLEILKNSKNLKKAIITSTSEVYGTAQYVPIDESHPISAQSPYAASKVASDQIALSFYKSFGTPISILRPFNTFGPRQSYRAVIPSIINQFINFNGQIKIGELNSTRDFTYVKDLVRCFYLSINGKKNLGKIINVGSGFEISIKKLIKLISEISGKKNFKLKIDNKKIRPKNSEVFRLLCKNDLAKKPLDGHPHLLIKQNLKFL